MSIPYSGGCIVSSLCMVVRNPWLLYNIHHCPVACKCAGVLAQRQIVIVYMLCVIGLEPGHSYALIFERLYHDRQTACFIQRVVIPVSIPLRRMELYDVTDHVTDIYIGYRSALQLLQSKLQHYLHTEKSSGTRGVVCKYLCTRGNQPIHDLLRLLVRLCHLIKAFTIEHIEYPVICT